MFLNGDRLPRNYHQSTLSYLSHANGVLIASLQALLPSCASIYVLRPFPHPLAIRTPFTVTSASNILILFLFHSDTASLNINLSLAPSQILDLLFADPQPP